MKNAKLYFWILTGILVPLLGYGSVTGLLGDPASNQVLINLGYPPYLNAFISAAKLIALVILVLPGLPKLKEWAYAGIVIDLSGAIYSIIAVGSPLSDILIPTFALLVVFGSYFFYHKLVTPEANYPTTAAHL